MLQFQEGERVLFARRIDLLGDEPVAFDEVFLPEHSANRLDKQDLAKLHFSNCWQKVQLMRIDYLTQSLEAVASEQTQVDHLGGEVGAPLLKEIDTMFLESGTSCGLFISYYRNDLFRITSTIRLQNPSKENSQ